MLIFCYTTFINSLDDKIVICYNLNYKNGKLFKKGSMIFMIGYIILALIVVLLIYAVSSYNGMVKMRNTYKEAFATMDVYMKKRWDLIPNLVETVKGYATHEKDTFSEIVNLRNSGNYSSMSDDEKIKNSTQMSKAISKLFALAENYPELKANTNFLDLSQQLKKIEEDIANSRKYFNGAVRLYNNKIQTFPNNIIASMFHFEEIKSFEIQDSERENVRVEF